MRTTARRRVKRGLFETLELLDPDKCAHFGELCIYPGLITVTVGHLAKIADCFGPRKDFGIVCAKTAAFHGGEGLGGVKAEHLRVAKAADQAPIHPRAK